VTTDKPSVLGLCVRDKAPVAAQLRVLDGTQVSSKGQAR
jgi:hypothetical protein